MADIEVAVIGTGVMGAAALWQLARRGVEAIGIERFEPGHDRGSSHGLTRVIRLAYYEHPSYVPLVRAARDLWLVLEKQSGRTLLHTTGIIEVGRPDSELIAGTLASSRQHALAHEVLDAKETMRRFPAFNLPEDFIGVWQPEAGFLEAEPAVLAQIALARKAGAQLRVLETVHAIEPTVGGVRIVTDRGALTAKRAIVSAGAWAKKFFPALPLRVTRNVLGWFEPLDRALFAPGHFPVFMMESAHGIHYGFPPRAEGLKIAKHFHLDQTVDPENYDRAVSPADEAAIRSALADHIPAANGPLRMTKTCLYTMTPDADFIIDRLPGAPQIVIASPCSGHGFKFAPVIGEILADLATAGTTRHDISRFRLDRFG